MRIKHQAGAAALVHESGTYTADDEGYLDVPFELAQTFLTQPGWEAEEAEIYVPEVEEPVNFFAAALAEAEATPAEERTPYQKGLLTRAANEAAKAAQAE
jgi:hypothetical protein